MTLSKEVDEFFRAHAAFWRYSLIDRANLQARAVNAGLLDNRGRVTDAGEKYLAAREEVVAEGIRELVEEGLYTDGGHHKQFILSEIAKAIGIPEGDWDKGIPG